MFTFNIFNEKLLVYGFVPLFLLYVWRYFNSKGWLSYANNERNQQILKKCPTILSKTFTPTFWLQHRLLQTALASNVKAIVPDLKYVTEEINMEGGGHTSLAWAIQNGEEKNSKQSKILMVVIPGLTGAAHDKYVMDIVGHLLKNGYRCVVYQPRFNGGQLILPQEGYLDILKDFKATMDQLRKKEKDVKLFGVGHSYGANLLVNYLGSFEDNGFVGGVSIANPWNLMLGENKMRRTVVDRVMTDFLQKTANRSSKSLADATRFNLNLEDLLSFKHVRDFDRNFTIKVYGYETVNDYYWAISSCRKIKSIKVPLLLLNAEDDPVVEAKGFVKEEIENYSPNVILMMTPRGGHQGWVEGFFNLKRWYMKPTVEFVNAVADIVE